MVSGLKDGMPATKKSFTVSQKREACKLAGLQARPRATPLGLLSLGRWVNETHGAMDSRLLSPL